MKFTNIAYTVSLLIVGVGLAVNGYSQSFLTNGLVGYYPFNGNAHDASGNGNDGTPLNTQSTSDRFGRANFALAFNGINGSTSPKTSELEIGMGGMHFAV